MASKAPISYRALNKKRVVEFENELEQKLSHLDSLEKELVQISKYRKKWLDNLCTTDNFEYDIYERRVDVFRAQAELSSLRMAEDILKVDECYERQTLNYLIEATAPFDCTSEQEIHEREFRMKRLIETENEALKHDLLEAAQSRLETVNFNGDLCNRIASIKMEVSQDQINQAKELKQTIFMYMDRMQKIVNASKKTHKKVTGDYLILRHNGKVARERLTRSQNKAAFARSQLQAGLEQLLTEATAQRDKLEVTTAAELKVMTNDIRNEVMQKERTVEGIMDNIKEIKYKKRRAHWHLKREIKKYEKKYNNLQSKRKNDLKLITKDLSKLKSTICAMEAKLIRRNSHRPNSSSSSIPSTCTTPSSPSSSRPSTYESPLFQSPTTTHSSLSQATLSRNGESSTTPDSNPDVSGQPSMVTHPSRRSGRSEPSHPSSLSRNQTMASSETSQQSPAIPSSLLVTSTRKMHSGKLAGGGRVSENGHDSGRATSLNTTFNSASTATYDDDSLYDEDEDNNEENEDFTYDSGTDDDDDLDEGSDESPSGSDNHSDDDNEEDDDDAEYDDEEIGTYSSDMPPSQHIKIASSRVENIEGSSTQSIALSMSSSKASAKYGNRQRSTMTSHIYGTKLGLSLP